MRKEHVLQSSLHFGPDTGPSTTVPSSHSGQAVTRMRMKLWGHPVCGHSVHGMPAFPPAPWALTCRHHASVIMHTQPKLEEPRSHVMHLRRWCAQLSPLLDNQSLKVVLQQGHVSWPCKAQCTTTAIHSCASRRFVNPDKIY